MIKRLKWNVLHADDGDDPGGLSSSSDESEQELPSAAALKILIENDPHLNPSGDARDVLQSKELRMLSQAHPRKRKRSADDHLEQGSSSDGEQYLTSDFDDNDEKQDQTNEIHSNEQPPEDLGYGFSEWHECILCRGKKFYNQEDLESHIQSKKHLKAVLKQSALTPQLEVDKGKHEPQTERTSDVDDEEDVERERRHPTVIAPTPQPLSSSRIRSKSKAKSEHSTKDSQSVLVTEESAIPDHDNKVKEEHRREAQADEARKRTKRKKEAAKRKLKSLKRRKWEKRNKEKEEFKPETLCQ